MKPKQLRTCKVSGCNRPLGPFNSSGFCYHHYHLTKQKERNKKLKKEHRCLRCGKLVQPKYPVRCENCNKIHRDKYSKRKLLKEDKL